VSHDSIHLFGGFTLDLARGCLLRGGEEVHLRPQSYEVLKYLAENQGRLVSKNELIEEVWRGRAVTDNSLSKCIEEVRMALGGHARQYVRNVRGRGYIFDPGADEWSEQIDVVKLVVQEEEEAEGEVAAPGVLTPAATQARLGPPRAARREKAFVLPAAGLLAACLAAGAAYYFSRPDRPANAAGVRSLAVLPFKPLVPEGRDEALELGMADTLIAKLSNVNEVTVRPLGAVRRYGGLEQDPFDAGRRLGVEAVLDGTVQRSGDRVGVRARLMHVGDRRQLWEGSFDATFGDIFSVQDAISEKVAAALKPRLTSAEERLLAKHYTENVEAYQLYLRGRYHVLKLTLPEIRKGISYFQQAVAVDPSYALAHVGLADAYRSALAGDMAPAEVLPKAKAAAQKAVELDDTLADAHAELGFIIFWYDWDWGAAETQFKRALGLDPNNADAHLFYAHLLSNTGRHAEGLAEAKRARELDPLDLRINALEGQFLLHAGRTDEALARLQKTLELEPNYYLARLVAASAYIEKEMYPEAISEARKASEVSGPSNTHPMGFLGYALAKSGRVAEARALLGGMSKSSAERYVSAYNLALIYHGLGERDEALRWLERGYSQRDQRIVFLKVEPKWDGLRGDPRFQDLLRRVGLQP
jgi:DNA-binding winged helix-turn-helix (wHTH) protein/TolB-like protein/Flp pilus assembly protein TadD